MLKTEFGSSNPVSLSQFYRNGALVPNYYVNRNIPTSGQISISNFYGAAGTLYLVPSPINWGNISASSTVTTVSGETNFQPFNGITDTITIRVVWNMTITRQPKTNTIAQVQARTTDGVISTIEWETNTTGSRTMDIEIVPGTNLKFYAYLGASNITDNTGSSGGMSGTVNITNLSVYDTAIDSFNVSLSAITPGGV